MPPVVLIFATEWMLGKSAQTWSIAVSYRMVILIQLESIKRKFENWVYRTNCSSNLDFMGLLLMEIVWMGTDLIGFLIDPKLLCGRANNRYPVIPPGFLVGCLRRSRQQGRCDDYEFPSSRHSNRFFKIQTSSGVNKSCWKSKWEFAFLITPPIVL